MFERAGASALQLEDQILPKRCGHLNAKSLISKNEMVGKIKAAVDARVDEEMLIIARTDAISVEGLESALDCADSYSEAGADVLFVEAPRTVAQLKMVSTRLGSKRPLLANMVEGGGTRPCTMPQLWEKWGFALSFFLVELSELLPVQRIITTHR